MATATLIWMILAWAIRTDGGTQMRAELHQATVEEYKEKSF